LEIKAYKTIKEKFETSEWNVYDWVKYTSWNDELKAEVEGIIKRHRVTQLGNIVPAPLLQPLIDSLPASWYKGISEDYEMKQPFGNLDTKVQKKVEQILGMSDVRFAKYMFDKDVEKFGQLEGNKITVGTRGKKELSKEKGWNLDKRNYCICGDPGIGKTLFSLLMFYVLANRRKRVVRICNNEWMYYDGSNVMMRKTEVWKEEDVYLLIDGKAGEEFLGKDKRAVLFASSSKENFWQFIKNTEGCIMYMKPWDYSELETFFGQMSEDERVKIGMPAKFEECRDMLTRRYDIV
ncbi:hypothetical protein ROZALSC1DRAFT_25628, partial [Rozella allomycis CSF55]